MKIIGIIVLLIIVFIVLFLAVMSVRHYVLLSKEEKHIKAIGTSVEVDGNRMNVYVTGAKSEKENPTIVLLSGSGVASPIYDYKVLYSRLTDKYRVAVVEKFGYGYSDISGISRDVATLAEEDIKALRKAGESGPYVLMPHSMSALEAIYWAQTYPHEVKAIIGLDMAVPDSYKENDHNLLKVTFNKMMTSFGMHRIPAFCYVNQDRLSKHEIEQHKYLIYRNTLNNDVYEECKMVYENAKTVKKLGTPDIPILMFTTNLGGSRGWKNWVEAQNEFAKQNDKYVQIKLECRHNLHYYESDYISHQIKEFMESLIVP